MSGSTRNSTTLLTHAARLTRLSSLHTYVVIRCLVDRDLVADGYRAYAYFRWLDDVLDKQLSDHAARMAMVAEQAELARRAFAGDSAQPACDEERLLLDLVRRRRPDHPGLASYIGCMMQVMQFDAERRGRLVSAAELTDYTRRLSTAVMDGLTYFIGNHDHYPAAAARYKAVAAAHISHMLRDAAEDEASGYYNIPRELLESHHLSPADMRAAPYRAWVRGRVDLADRLFREGRQYIHSLSNPRARLAGLAYCANFESVLRRVRRNDYVLVGLRPSLKLICRASPRPTPYAPAVHSRRRASPVAHH